MSGGGGPGSGHGRHDGSLDNASRSGCPGSPMLQPPLCRSVLLLLPREVAEVEGAVTAATRLPRNDIVLCLPHISHATVNPWNRLKILFLKNFFILVAIIGTYDYDPERQREDLSIRSIKDAGDSDGTASDGDAGEGADGGAAQLAVHPLRHEPLPAGGHALRPLDRLRVDHYPHHYR